MVGVSRRIIQHSLKSITPVAHKHRVLSSEKSKAVMKEVEEWIKACINAGATYQRLVDSAFQAQLGRNLEAYVDDMVIKSKTEQEMMMAISETFDNLRKVNMKLNLKKCSIRVNVET
ncbi:reverse transcriptase domain-containing protein [Tanacetum coccineum]